jgi:hypothetical protein
MDASSKKAASLAPTDDGSQFLAMMNDKTSTLTPNHDTE